MSFAVADSGFGDGVQPGWSDCWRHGNLNMQSRQKRPAYEP